MVMNFVSLFIWRYGYFFLFGVVYYYEQLVVDSGGGEQFGVGVFFEVGFVQILDGGGVVVVIVFFIVFRIRNDGCWVVLVKFF